ncbi:MAG: metal-dependent hydrolase [Pseudomonadota bacterium]
MPTTFTHAVFPLVIAAAAGTKIVSPRLALAGAVFAVLPDADLIGFRFGVEYADDWGHRGASHSLALAAFCAGLTAIIWKEARSFIGFAFLFLAMASNGLLDALTDGGLGVALLWPFDSVRIFAPITPIDVSPIGLDVFSTRGLKSLWSELQWVWLPSFGLAAVAMACRKGAYLFRDPAEPS